MPQRNERGCWCIVRVGRNSHHKCLVQQHIPGRGEWHDWSHDKGGCTNGLNGFGG